MSPDARSAYDSAVEQIPEDGRLVLFADLRPSHVYAFAGSEVVALVVHEIEAVIRDLPVEGGAVTLPGGRQVRAAEVINLDVSEFGEGEPGLAYYVLHLDTQARVVDDWFLPNLDALDNVRATFPRATWEELPPDRAAALDRIRECQAKPPQPA